MKKIGLLVKEISENRIKAYLKKSGTVFILKYSGLSSPDITALRQSLKASHADVFVVKNSVARRALKDTGVEAIVKAIEGPCGLVFIPEEPVEASRVLFNFSKDHDKLKLAGGLLQDKFLETKDIEAISKLPSKETLRTRAVIAIKSPITGFVMVLHNTLQKLVICLDQIKQKKGS